MPVRGNRTLSKVTQPERGARTSRKLSLHAPYSPSVQNISSSSGMKPQSTSEQPSWEGEDTMMSSNSSDHRGLRMTPHDGATLWRCVIRLSDTRPGFRSSQVSRCSHCTVTASSESAKSAHDAAHHRTRPCQTTLRNI
eukprot:619785-Rhodomonas_salina.5